MSFPNQHKAELETFSRLSCQIGDRADYTQGGGGNTSVKTDDGIMAIKASGFRLSDITPTSAYAIIDYKPLASFYYTNEPGDLEDVEKSGSSRAKELTLTDPDLPSLRPSVEAGFHSILKKYVLHSHAAYCNLAACCAEYEQILAEAFKDASFTYAVVPYTDPGAKLTFIIRDALMEKEKADGKQPEVIIMINHGLVVHHDDPERALALHEEVNNLIAAYFGFDPAQYPAVALKEQDDGSFTSDTAYLTELLRSGKYPASALLANPLYPDQMVFFSGTLLPEGEPLRDGTCVIDPDTGIVTYRTKASQALALEQVLTAVVFILEKLAENGLHAQYMGQDARSFIDNWESEKYRKSLQQK